MQTFITTAEAAAQIGCSKPTVTRHAATHGLGQRIGQMLVFSPAEVEAIRGLVRPVGSPAFVPGNDLWRLRGAKKAAKTGGERRRKKSQK